MNTRKFRSLGLPILGVGLAVVSLIALAGPGRTEEKKKAEHAEHGEHGHMMDGCAKACSDCQRACDSCVTHCSGQLAQGKKDHLTTLATCLDCSAICSAASQVVARGGPFSGIICKACVECCAKCASACEKFPEEGHMKACAEECRKCEKACEAMLKHVGK